VSVGVISLMKFVEIRFPVSIALSILMPISLAEFWPSITIFLISLKIGSVRDVSILILSVKPFNVLLMSLSVVFVIFFVETSLIHSKLASTVHASNFVSMSVTCVYNCIGIYYDAVVSLICELHVLSLPCVFVLSIEFDWRVLVSWLFLSVGMIFDLHLR